MSRQIGGFSLQFEVQNFIKSEYFILLLNDSPLVSSPFMATREASREITREREEHSKPVIPRTLVFFRVLLSGDFSRLSQMESLLAG